MPWNQFWTVLLQAAVAVLLLSFPLAVLVASVTAAWAKNGGGVRGEQGPVGPQGPMGPAGPTGVPGYLTTTPCLGTGPWQVN